MKRYDAALAIAASVIFGGLAFMAPANAAPPTVTPSPGYDARLQQQHATPSAASSVIYQPAAPVHRRHVKRTHGEGH